MRVERSKSTDGDDLLTVTFTRASPDSRQPEIEVVFAVKYPCVLGERTMVINQLSATRTDTRQPATTTPEEENQISQAAADFLSED